MIPGATGGERRLLPAALLACALAGALGCERPVPRAELAGRLAALEHPHVVLIVVDTLRADWTTPYGYAQDTSPELARWAARGVLFEHALSQSSWTKISMASLLSSLWPGTHGLSKFHDGLGEGALILPEVFQQAGYRSYGVQTNGWLHSSFGFEQGFDRYVFPSGRLGGASTLPEATLWPHAERVFEETTRILDAHPSDQPMFLYIHLMDVHEYGAPPEYRTFGADDRGHYKAAIRWVDALLERVRKSLDERGLLDRSVLVLASDHGESFGENGGVGHARHVFTPILRVPLVIRLPFAIEPIRVPQQVRNLDLAPTLLELAGIPIPPSFEGALAAAARDRRGRRRGRPHQSRRDGTAAVSGRDGAEVRDRRILDLCAEFGSRRGPPRVPVRPAGGSGRRREPDRARAAGGRAHARAARAAVRGASAARPAPPRGPDRALDRGAPARDGLPAVVRRNARWSSYATGWR